MSLRPAAPILSYMDIRIIKVGGFPSEAESAQICSELLDAVDEDRHVVIDVSELIGVNWHLLTVLMAGTRQRAKKGGRLAMVGAGHPLLAALELAGVYRAFELYPTQAAAIRQISGGERR